MVIYGEYNIKLHHKRTHVSVRAILPPSWGSKDLVHNAGDGV
ncbi:hypothetical protein ES705_07276 [subsurface metagenome]